MAKREYRDGPSGMKMLLPEKREKMGRHPKCCFWFSYGPFNNRPDVDIVGDVSDFSLEQYNDRKVRIVPEADYRRLMAAWKREQAAK